MINYKVIPLGELLLGEYSQKIISEAFKKFSCQREHDLEDFLLRKAVTYENMGFGKTYLVIDEDRLRKGEFVVVAYFTIAQRAIDISQMSGKKKRRFLGNYPGRDSLNAVPAYLIGQLGRCDEYTAKEFPGEQLLNECYHAISMAARVVGGNLIILECRECMYEKFYSSQNFMKLYDELNEEKLYTLYKKVDFSEYWNRCLCVE